MRVKHIAAEEHNTMMNDKQTKGVVSDSPGLQAFCSRAIGFSFLLAQYASGFGVEIFKEMLYLTKLLLVISYLTVL